MRPGERNCTELCTVEKKNSDGGKKVKKTGETKVSPVFLSASAAAAPLAVDAAVQVGHLPLRGGEELLELVLKGLVRGGHQRGLLTGESGPGLGGAAGSAGMGGRAAGTGGAAGTGPEGRALLLGQRLLDGKIDLPVFRGEDQHLHGLPLLQKVMYVVDKAVGDLRNVDQSGLPIVQGHKRAEFGDGGHLAFHNAPNLRLHMVCFFSFR